MGTRGPMLSVEPCRVAPACQRLEGNVLEDLAMEDANLVWKDGMPRKRGTMSMKYVPFSSPLSPLSVGRARTLAPFSAASRTL